MDIFSIFSTAHYSSHAPPPFSATILAVRPHYYHHPSSASAIFSTKQPSEPPENSPPTRIRRPASHKPPKTTKITKTSNDAKIHTNPLKSLLITQHTPSSTRPTAPSLTSKLRLTSKLAPPPLAPPPPSPPDILVEMPPEEAMETTRGPEDEFVEKGKIFVGNLPLWIKKNEVAEFFRQFGPIKNVILIKGYDDNERNMGFGFVIYGGPTADKAAMMAVEFDGMEFHGRVLTVKLDDGRRLKGKTRERVGWVEGKDDGSRQHKSSWHQEREGSRMDLRRVIDSQPENWQAVVTAFERIKKPSRREYGLMIKYYARRGDKHRARSTFEGMRARGIEPNSHVFTSLVHAYAVAKDMEEALSCVRQMHDEGVEMTLVTYSIVVGGFARIGNVE